MVASPKKPKTVCTRSTGSTTEPSKSVNAAATRSVCGSKICGRKVTEGIECSICRLWFHTKCSGLSPDDLIQHRADPDKPWFCTCCVQSPLILYFTQMLKKQEAKIDKLEKRLRQLELSSVQQHPTCPEPSLTTDSCSLNGSTTFASVVTDTAQNSSHPSIVSRRSVAVSKSNAPTRSVVPPRRSDNLTVICTNIPESTSPCFKTRQFEDAQQWRSICETLQVLPTPESLVRLTTPPKSLHAGEPRLL